MQSNEMQQQIINKLKTIIKTKIIQCLIIFDHVHPKHFQSPLNLHEFVPAFKKSVKKFLKNQ